ncbi:AfsR/SARP family transcriptional regulator [Micromonospora zingiberis]|uniref:AfsR/SARP family transcriptional regulator n=1 Tax=Micromonospora zingiberis TaxID=2053011 RepID=UPI0013F3CFE2|nr:AfsR/SARP family transcriptional regulator [Micromonospora zingiberis]
MKFRVLGVLAVHDDAGLPVAVPPGHPSRLLTGLLLRAGHRVPIEELADLLWEADPPKSHRANLQTHVSRLRRLLPGVSIRREVAGYRIEVDPADIDAHLFGREVDAGLRAADRGEYVRAEAHLRQALARCHGPPLVASGVGAFAADLARLAELRLVAEEALLGVEVGGGRHRAAIVRARALVQEHPLREPMWALLMEALARDGRFAEALDTFHQVRGILRDELGTAPGQRLTAIHRAVLQGKPPADRRTTARPPAGADPVCQVPLATADFTGQDKALSDLVTRLTPTDRPAPPIVVVSGPPGVGKTTLAVHAAHALRADYPDGALFIRLSGATRQARAPGEVLLDLIQGIGGSTSPGRDNVETRSAAWRALAADRRLLVVLDDAATGNELLPLLPGTAGCAVLVTSRRRITDLPGAGLLLVQPLTDEQGLVMLRRIVGVDRVAADAAAAERIRDYCANLPLALRIAGARLAARPDLSLADFAERLADERRRLDELSTSDHAVRGSLRLSYQDLDPTARQLLRRLAVLGTREVPAAALALLAGTDAVRADAAVEHLVGANLLDTTTTGQGEPRYRLHDLLRTFGRERAVLEEPAADLDLALKGLVAAAATAARAATARLPYPSFNPAPPQATAGTTPPAVLLRQVRKDPRTWLRTERSNLVAACRYAAARGWLDLAVGLAAALNSHLWTEGRLDELAQVHRAVRLAATRLGDQEHLAWSVFMNARLAGMRGELDVARRGFRDARDRAAGRSMPQLVGHSLAASSLYRAEGRAGDETSVRYGRLAVAVFRRIGDRAGEVEALRATALALNRPDRPGAALAVLDDALPIIDRLDDPMARAMLLNARAGILTVAGRYAEGARDCRRCIDLLRGIGERVLRAYAHSQLGYLLLGLDRVDEAVPEFATALDLGVEFGDQTLITCMERNLALNLCRLGLDRQAADVVGRCAETLRRLGNLGRASLTLRLLAVVHERLGDRAGATAARLVADRTAAADLFNDERLALLRRLVEGPIGEPA